MTEGEWLQCTDPTPMLEFLSGRASDRKLRLFAVICGRRVAEWMTDEGSRHALDVSEQYAEGAVGRRGLAAARRAAYEATRSSGVVPSVARLHYPIASHAANVALYAASAPVRYEASEIARITAGTASSLLWHVYGGNADAAEMLIQAQLLRDIIGNPFRPVAFDPAWLTTTVLNLSRAAYEERIMPSGELDLERLAVLSDALEEAGCDKPDILDHLRSPGPHVRGCWAVDLLLGKE